MNTRTVKEHIMSKPGLLYTLVIIINADILILLTKAKNILVQMEGKNPHVTGSTQVVTAIGTRISIVKKCGHKT